MNAKSPELINIFQIYDSVVFSRIGYVHDFTFFPLMLPHLFTDCWMQNFFFRQKKKLKVSAFMSVSALSQNIHF